MSTDRISTWTATHKGLVIGVTADDTKLFEPFVVGRSVFPDDTILESILIPGATGFQGAKYVNLLRKWKGYVAHPQDERINPIEFPMAFTGERFSLKNSRYINGVVHEINIDGIEGATLDGADLSVTEQREFTAERIMTLLRDAVDFRVAKIQAMNADSLFVSERMEMVD